MKQANFKRMGYERDPKSGLILPSALVGKGLRLLAEGRFGVPEAKSPRFQNPLLSGVEDVINQPIYDSFSVAAAAAMPTITSLFQAPIGSAGKTLANTNMVLNGVLPAPQRLFVRAFRLFFQNNAAPADLNNFAVNNTVEVIVGTKNYLQVPGFALSAGCGMIATAAGQVGTAPAGTSAVVTTSNGIPDQRSIMALTQPFVIESSEAFRVDIRTQTAWNLAAAGANPVGTGLTIYFLFDGDLYRGVQ